VQSGGDYADFLSGVVLACARYVENPSVLDYSDYSDGTRACFLDLEAGC
jgi:hypothetical protein